MLAAGNLSKEEGRIAKDQGDHHEGVPSTSVIIDGGWSKRTHKHLQNAFGWVVVVIGLYTKKLLDIQVRNNTALEEDILAAGKEEVRLAQDGGDYHEGVPSTSVIIDGGWSKKTHKHSYNALGGVVVVISHRTLY